MSSGTIFSQKVSQKYFETVCGSCIEHRKKKSGLPHTKKIDSYDPENWTGSVQFLDCDSPTNNNNTKKSEKEINFAIVVVGWTITV
jgi:hypothetical protein